MSMSRPRSTAASAWTECIATECSPGLYPPSPPSPLSKSPNLFTTYSRSENFLGRFCSMDFGTLLSWKPKTSLRRAEASSKAAPATRSLIDRSPATSFHDRRRSMGSPCRALKRRRRERSVTTCSRVEAWRLARLVRSLAFAGRAGWDASGGCWERKKTSPPPSPSPSSSLPSPSPSEPPDCSGSGSGSGAGRFFRPRGIPPPLVLLLLGLVGVGNRSGRFMSGTLLILFFGNKRRLSAGGCRQDPTARGSRSRAKCKCRV
mmetsp:Transcript_10717/g.31714  ORF Transcript_10717/g.31714 Transcript_10717/m.31714 type:complete len:261 (-) Transcript_10717:74-856(-)